MAVGIKCPGCQEVKRLLWKNGEYVYAWCRKCRRLLKAKQLKD